MTRDITNAQKRLDRLQAKRAEREHNETVHRAGFNNSDDYDAWRVLEDLRNLTLSERRAAEEAAAPKKAAGASITINSTGMRDNGGIVGHPGPLSHQLRNAY